MSDVITLLSLGLNCFKLNSDTCEIKIGSDKGCSSAQDNIQLEKNLKLDSFIGILQRNHIMLQYAFGADFLPIADVRKR